MPLDRSGSKAAVGHNIKAEESAGKPPRQALAIALNVQRDNAKGSRKALLEAAYKKHMKSKEEEGESKAETKKAEMEEM